MKYDRSVLGTAGVGAIALALALAGCSQSGSPYGPSAGTPGLVPGAQAGSPVAVAPLNGASEDNSDVTSPDGFKHRRHHHHHHHGYCAAVTNSQNFNGQAIPKKAWMLFTSVTQFPGNQSGARVYVKDSQVLFTDGIHAYKIKGPNMEFTLGTPNVRLRWNMSSKFQPGGWAMRAPSNTGGNDFLDDMVWQVPHALPGNIQNVTWSAKFYSRSDIQQMHWQWGAAVYARLTDKYNRLGIKPLDDNHYPPYNNDKAGSPERYKGWVEQGGTGGGGNDYTGVGGPTVNVTPCV